MKQIKWVLAQVKAWAIRDRKLIGAAFAAGLVFTAVAGGATKAYADKVQGDIAQEVIRFHVKANSNDPQDQMLKLAVKDKILSQFEDELNDATDIEETREILFLKMDEIKECAEEEIHKQGFDYPVNVEMATVFFPTKHYGDMSMPPGNYEALRVNIGDAEGENWWCVMYPPLCYVDVTQASVADTTKVKLKNVLTDDEFKIISLNQAKNSNTKMDVKVKFKIVEWWKNKEEAKALKQNNQMALRS